MAVMGVGHQMEKGQVTGEKNFMPRQKGDDVSPGMSGPRKVEFDDVAADVEDQVVFKGDAWRRQLAHLGAVGYALLFRPRPWGCGHSPQDFLTAVWMAQNLRRQEELVSGYVVAVVMRVNQLRDRLAARGLLGCCKERFGLQRKSQSIQGH